MGFDGFDIAVFFGGRMRATFEGLKDPDRLARAAQQIRVWRAVCRTRLQLELKSSIKRKTQLDSSTLLMQ
jgi:hypothetical protein